MAGDETKEYPLPAAADQDRQPRLSRLRLAERLVGPEVPARECHPLLGPHASQELARFAELREAGGDGREVVPVHRRLGLVPAGAEAHDQTAARDDVECRRHLRDERGRPVADAEHEMTEADPTRDGRDRADLGPRLEGRVLLERDADEVVDAPHGVEARLVGRLGHLARLVPARSELREADAEVGPDRHGSRDWSEARACGNRAWRASRRAATLRPRCAPFAVPPAGRRRRGSRTRIGPSAPTAAGSSTWPPGRTSAIASPATRYPRREPRRSTTRRPTSASACRSTRRPSSTRAPSSIRAS